jgi:Asp-tRNA(Asn)/Glu-tRNA(Gln) amidotransferase A subunit family amidase
MDFRQVPVSELGRGVREGRWSARELVSGALARIEGLDGALGAFVAVDGERALEEAGAVDEAVAAGRPVGPLAGVPLAVKDLEPAAGFVTSRGSALFADGPPAVQDSELVARLRRAGCVVVGKTNTPELGWYAHTWNPSFGHTWNPWSTEHSPGGSSGGSAAAVAAGMVPLATGSDGGGSIRIPASCCGLAGVKPSFGRVPSGGVEPPDWHELSTRGVLARTVADVVGVLDLVVGPDPSDLRSLPRAEASWPAAVAEPRVPAVVAWSPTLGYARVDGEVRAICEAAVRRIEELGAVVETIEGVFAADPLDDWLRLATAYNLRTLAPFRGGPRWEEVDPLLAAQVDRAAALNALELVRAQDAGHRLNLRLVDLFHRARLLVTPTIATPPPPISTDLGLVDGEPEINWVAFTYPFNLTRSPAASVCVGRTEAGLPVGL